MTFRKNIKRPLVILFLAFVLILIIVLAVFLYANRSKINSPIYKDGYVTFSGTVTGRSNECEVDGTCSISVNGNIIVTGGGLSVNPIDNIYGSSGNVKIGDKVNVKAVQSSNGYTLQGCSSCFIRKE